MKELFPLPPVVLQQFAVAKKMKLATIDDKIKATSAYLNFQSRFN